ncbi:MAG: D-alanine--D-alanine ligase [Verrucomicrobiota bacterium]|jgi:D-alanine-D-alanine ligase
MKNLKVAVLMGGPSAEAEVSRKSGAMVAAALRQAGMTVVPVDLQGTEVNLPADVDVAFIAMHGTFGEDGQIQRILEDHGVAYTGSDPGASARAFDKVLAKECFIEDGIPTPKSVVFDGVNLPEELRWPLFVKPARQGSSVGISRVDDLSALLQAYQQAKQFDSQVLVEEFVRGREFTVGILDGTALPVVEIRTKREFFDYEAKYIAGAAEEICPATLDETRTMWAKTFALRAHDCLGCRDYSRVDLMLDEETGKFFVLEVNTLPGMTANSLLPKAARAAGLEMPALCSRMVELALARRMEAVTV